MSRCLAFALAATLLVPGGSVLAQAASERPSPAKANEDLRERIEALRQRIRTALDRRELDNEDAAQALRDLRDIRGDAETVWARNGDRLPDAERIRLQARLDRLARETRWLPSRPPAASPAAARLWSLQRREYWLDQRIARSLANNEIEAAEAARAREELTDIRYQDQRFRAGQGGRLSERDLARLEERLDRLIASIHWAHEPSEHRPW